MSFSFLGGSFLGALLFGYPYQGLALVDLAALALVGFVLVYLFLSRKDRQGGDDKFTVGRRRGASSTTVPRDLSVGKAPTRSPKRGAAEYGPQRRDSGLPQRDQRPFGNADGGRLGERAAASPPAQPAPPSPAARSDGDAGEEAFEEAFLEEARGLYIRLQEAWAARDVERLSPFVSPELLAVLRENAAADPDPIRVEIVRLDARTLSAARRQDGKGAMATVRFDALMSTGGLAPVPVAELWHFERGSAANSAWLLDGIETDGE